MITSHFNTTQIVLVSLGGFFTLLSTFCFVNGKYNWAIASLFIGALFIHFFAAALDPFLNLWDERFHALVAKNMLQHPFVPKLYPEKAVTWFYSYWDRGYIWLHKQPLFLWQMALSMKVFGVNEFAVRFPSVIMGSVLVLFSYRVGKLLVNERLGYYSAFITATAPFVLKLVSGGQELDHNDLAFTFYISASIWAYIEYYFSQKKYWIILIGVFAGCAILNKWLVGLLIYSCWGLNLLLNKEKISPRKFHYLIISVVVCVLIFLPWQIYILQRFHDLAMEEYRFNSRHFTEVLEGHSGGIFFHLNNIVELYGIYSMPVIIIGFISLWYRIKDPIVKHGIFVMPLLIYLVFTIAKTKVGSHPFCISLVIFLAMGACIYEVTLLLSKYLKSQKAVSLLTLLLLLILGYENINVNKLERRHTLAKKENTYTLRMMSNKRIYESLNQKLPKGTVVFNVKSEHYVELMFYTDFIAYDFIPTWNQYYELLDKQRPIAIFTQGIQLPFYLAADKNITLLTDTLSN